MILNCQIWLVCEILSNLKDGAPPESRLCGITSPSSSDGVNTTLGSSNVIGKVTK